MPSIPWIRRFSPPFPRWGVLFAFLALIFSGLPVWAHSSLEAFSRSRNPAVPVEVQSITDPGRLKPGESFHLHVLVKLGGGWHIYSMKTPGEDESLATQIQFLKNIFPPRGPWREPEPEIIKDRALDKVVRTFHGTVEFIRVLGVPKDLEPGLYSIAGHVVFRACDNKICNLPSKIPFAAQVRVLGEKAPE
ncbi:MAG: hypothetical protein ACE5E9_01480 [Nitrospinaceae bacterium]